MRFTPTNLDGAYLIEPERRGDERGHFARVWCAREFEQQGLDSRVVQINAAYSPRRGTLRGLHFQSHPFAEIKLVRCTRGEIFDVIIDLRPDSPTLARWEGFKLTAANGRMLHVPEGFAHGYQTLADDTEITYQTTCEYEPRAASGVRWDDPAFGIEWPLPPATISAADRGWPDFQSPASNGTAHRPFSILGKL